MKKILQIFVFISLGMAVLVFLSNKAIETERTYFRQLFLKNNQDFAVLAARHVADELLEIKSDMQVYSHFILKNQLEPDRVQEYFKYNFESNKQISGIALHRSEIEEPQKYYSLAFPVDKDSFSIKNKIQRDTLLRKDIDRFLDAFQSRDHVYLSWVQMIRDRRKGGVPGLLEARISLNRVFELASTVVEARGGSIFLTDANGNVLVPSHSGWKLSPSEIRTIQSKGIGGFLREGSTSEELLSFCSLKMIHKLYLPDFKIVVAQDPKQMIRVTNRLQWNIYTLLGIGILCLLLLARLLFWR